jgi:hypothetical protein
MKSFSDGDNYNLHYVIRRKIADFAIAIINRNPAGLVVVVVVVRSVVVVVSTTVCHIRDSYY